MTAREQFVRLQQDIIRMQDHHSAKNIAEDNAGLSMISEAFPNHSFPLGALHEFICSSIETTSAASGFISGIAASIMKGNSAGAWIGSSGTVFPHALSSFGLQPEQFLFIEPTKEKDRLWCIEEALKCDGFSVVIADTGNIGFMETRRFQLAVEQSAVTAFVLRRHRPAPMSSCAVTRWQVQSMIGTKDDLPGIGFPQWRVDLLKVRNGKPGSWDIGWKENKFELITEEITASSFLRKVV